MYAGANPLNTFDPTGHSALLDTLAAVGFVTLLFGIDLAGISGAIRLSRFLFNHIFPKASEAETIGIDVVASDWSGGWIPFYSGYENWGIVTANAFSYLNPTADHIINSKDVFDMVDQIEQWSRFRGGAKIDTITFRGHGSPYGFYPGPSSANVFE